METARPGQPPPDKNRGPQMLAIVWSLSAVSTIMVALRCYARWTIRGLGWDDWAMVMAMIFYTIGNSILIHEVHLGSGRHAYYLSRQQILEAARWTHVSQPWILLVYSTARISVALLTLRFIGVASFWRRWLLIYVMVSSLIVNVLTIALSLSQCSPRSALWNHSIPGATCWPKHVMMSYTYFLFAYNCFCDVVLALLPATFIYKLQMDSAKKRILTVVLGLGLLAAVCSGIKIKFQHELQERVDFTWLSYDIVMWSSAEAFLLIFCGCVPTLMPLWDRFVSKKLTSPDQVPLRPSAGSFGMHRIKNRLWSDRTRGSGTMTEVGSSRPGGVEHPAERIHVTNSYHVNHESFEKV